MTRCSKIERSTRSLTYILRIWIECLARSDESSAHICDHLWEKSKIYKVMKCRSSNQTKFDCTLITLTLHSPFGFGMHTNELAIWALNIPWFPRTHIWLQLDWDHITLCSVLLTFTFRTKSSPISALTSEVKESFFKVHFTLSTTTHNKTSTKAILLSLKQVNYLAR